MGGYALLSRKKNCHARWGPDLRREWLYGASCFLFGAAGVWALIHSASVCAWLAHTHAGSKWPYFTEWSFRAQAWACIVQSFASYVSDVMLTDTRSIAHPIDRIMAIVLTLIAVYFEITIVLFSAMPMRLRALMLGLVAAGIFWHFKAKFAIVHRQYQMYVTNHTLWHFAIVSSMVVPLHLAVITSGESPLAG